MHALPEWYDQHKRDLPWRRQPSPYAVLVSELMLQQTRVDTVVAYFERWMARWPTLADLAAADLDDVLAQWTGLGYYNRARNLHRTAQEVVRRHGGALPTDAAQLAALPGIGPYTVGAIRSIAFGLPAPLVDGNVSRVLQRWHGIDGPANAPAVVKAVWRQAEQWLADGVARDRPGVWNQALMELGATVCTPRQPTCGVCPVRGGCQVAAVGRQHEVPSPKERKPPRLQLATYVLVVRFDGAVLVARRPASGRWAGLWEPPGWEGPRAHETARAWLTGRGLVEQGVLTPLVHVLTHRRYEVLPLLARAGDVAPDLSAEGYLATRWVPLTAAADPTSGLSRLASRLLALVEPGS
jgi:A/G-specific adenine glycosylase